MAERVRVGFSVDKVILVVAIAAILLSAWLYFDAMGLYRAAVEASMLAWHTYTVEWGTKWAHFFVDGEPVLESAPSPRGPLGFVMWLDNQYMVVTPQGRAGWGLLDVPGRQWMEVDQLAITPG